MAEKSIIVSVGGGKVSAEVPSNMAEGNLRDLESNHAIGKQCQK